MEREKPTEHPHVLPPKNPQLLGGEEKINPELDAAFRKTQNKVIEELGLNFNEDRT